MELFKDICYILAGLGVFLLGMHLMGEGLQKIAGKGVKVLFNKLNDKKAVSFGIGVTVTAVVQASSVTNVIAIGFVNAGLMTLPTALTICLGAKVGTTATGLLASLSSLPISAVFCVVALIGTCFVLFSKKEKLVQIGYIIGGLGTLFTGMYLMKTTIQANPDIMLLIQTLFKSISIPAVLVLVGIFSTILVQSSSTISVILIALIGVNAIEFNAGMYILIGASIGTCFTALLAAIGASKDGLRLAILNLLCSIFSGIFLSIVLGLLEEFIVIEDVGLITKAFSIIPDPSWSLSVFGFVYNLIAALLMIPFTTPLSKLSKKIIKDSLKEETILHTHYIDDRLFKTPQLAIMQVKKEISHMGELAMENLDRGLNALINKQYVEKEVLVLTEDQIDYITKKTSLYLVELAGLKINRDDEVFVGSMHHVIDDIERIGDHAVDFYSQASKMDEEGYNFSDEAKNELIEIRNQVFDMAKMTFYIYDKKEVAELPIISNYATAIRCLKKQSSNNHIARLNKGGCDTETGTFFYSAITALERIAEHLVNIAFSIKSITGSQSEAYAKIKQEG